MFPDILYSPHTENIQSMLLFTDTIGGHNVNSTSVLNFEFFQRNQQLFVLQGLLLNISYRGSVKGTRALD